jgi:hypothetical protein
VIVVLAVIPTLTGVTSTQYAVSLLALSVHLTATEVPAAFGSAEMSDGAATGIIGVVTGTGPAEAVPRLFTTVIV